MNNFILPIIFIVIGGIGIAGTLWLSSSRIRSRGITISKGSEWFTISPDVLEAELSMSLREKFRMMLKIVLIWMIALYRKLAREITVKQILKKKVRAFLYDHTPEGIRHPSEFWHRVHHKTSRSSPGSASQNHPLHYRGEGQQTTDQIIENKE